VHKGIAPLWWIVLHDPVDVRDVDASGAEIGGQKDRMALLLEVFGLLLGSLCHFKFGALELSVDFGPLLLINFAVELKNLNCSPG